MIALSIRQPWAWLIVHGFKDIENREWHTLFRGRLLIHASKTCTKEQYFDAVEFARQVVPGIVIPSLAALPRGGIVGEVVVTNCTQVSKSPWFVGPYGFELTNPKQHPIWPCAGRLGFFDVKWPDPVKIAEAGERLANAGLYFNALGGLK